MNRARLFEIRDRLDASARELMERKNRDYSTDANSIENYVHAARQAKITPALYIVGRVEEKLTRLSNILKNGAAVVDEPVLAELRDLVNFPSLIAAAVEMESEKEVTP
jgi:hypothetical protein